MPIIYLFSFCVILGLDALFLLETYVTPIWPLGKARSIVFSPFPQPPHFPPSRCLSHQRSSLCEMSSKIRWMFKFKTLLQWKHIAIFPSRILLQALNTHPVMLNHFLKHLWSPLECLCCHCCLSVVSHFKMLTVHSHLDFGCEVQLRWARIHCNAFPLDATQQQQTPHRRAFLELLQKMSGVKD